MDADGPLNLILFCNQLNLKGDPLNSCILDDIGKTNYLQIVLDRWIGSGRVNKIITDTPELV